METGNSLVTTTETECTRNALLMNPKTAHLIPAEPADYFQVSNIQLNDQVMFRIWEFMINQYGRKWPEQFGEFYDPDGNITATVHHWAQALSRIPLNRIERAMTKCFQERESPFPPTLPEFYKLCEREPWE